MKVVANVGSVLHCAHAIEAARFLKAECLTLIVPNSIPTRAAAQIQCFFNDHSRLETALDMKLYLVFAQSSRKFLVQYLKFADIHLCADDRGKIGFINNVMSLVFRRQFGLIEDGELAYCWQNVAKFAPPKNLAKRVLHFILRINLGYGENWSTSMVFVTDSDQFTRGRGPKNYLVARQEVVEIPNCFRLYEEIYPILEEHVRAEITSAGEAVQRLLSSNVIFLLLGGGPSSPAELRSRLPQRDFLVLPHPASRTGGCAPPGWEELPGSVPAEWLILFLLRAEKDINLFMTRSSVGRYAKQHFAGLVHQNLLHVEDVVRVSDEEAYFAGLHDLSREQQENNQAELGAHSEAG